MNEPVMNEPVMNESSIVESLPVEDEPSFKHVPSFISLPIDGDHLDINSDQRPSNQELVPITINWLYSLYKAGLSYHPDDDISEVCWAKVKLKDLSPKQRKESLKFFSDEELKFFSKDDQISINYNMEICKEILGEDIYSIVYLFDQGLVKPVDI